MKNLAELTTIWLTGPLLLACSSPSQQEATTDDHAGGRQTEMSIHEGKGMVVAIPPNKKHIIIKHEEIPGLMRPMTMPFNIKDSSMIEGIHPQDSVRLLLEYDGNEVVLKELERIE